MAVGIVLSFLFAQHLTKPLRQLQAGVLNITEDNLADPLPVTNLKEIADVTHAVNTLKISLAQHVRSMQELMANVSHEMRTPLTRMSLAVACLDEGVKSIYTKCEEKKHGELTACSESLSLVSKYSAYLKEDLEHIEKVVGSILLSNKLDLWQEMNLIPFDISHLCDDVISIHKLVAQEKQMQIATDIDERIILPADETLIRRVFFNVLDNAIRYSSSGSEIRMELKRKRGGKAACFFVENACPPIQEEVLQRIFEPFYRARQQDEYGVGLGLYLVKKIIRLHGGHVHAKYKDGFFQICIQFSLHHSEGLEFCNSTQSQG